MPFSAKVVAYSKAAGYPNLATLQLRYPRFIHPEFMTHRVFSRNASSSRAVPVLKFIEQVMNDPAVPVHFGKNQPGMQADGEISDKEEAKTLWYEAANLAVNVAKDMAAKGVHKQVVNRILEPFLHIDVVVTSCRWDNFFELRRHKDAQPEIKALADTMFTALSNAEPTELGPNDWHLPYVTEEDKENKPTQILKRVSAARCARVSYLNHDQSQPNTFKDLELAHKLEESGHLSPFEHQASTDMAGYKNIAPWLQYREELE